MNDEKTLPPRVTVCNMWVDPLKHTNELQESVEAPCDGFCALCGDGGWPQGAECRRIHAAKAAGTFSPVYDTTTGERLELEQEEDNADG